jgi:hypothetical protein
MERAPRVVLFFLGDAERVFAGMRERRLVRVPGKRAAEVPEREPHPAADGAVGTVAVAEDAVARIDPERAGDRPFTITSDTHMCVVCSTPFRLCAGSSMASIAARTTGKCSGRQPPITALIASFSIVASPPFGGIAPRLSCGSRPTCAMSASTRGRVGRTIGSPSVQLRS